MTHARLAGQCAYLLRSVLIRRQVPILPVAPVTTMGSWAASSAISPSIVPGREPVGEEVA